MRKGDEARSQRQSVATKHENSQPIWTSELRITPNLEKQRIVERAGMALRVKINQPNTNTGSCDVGKIATGKQDVEGQTRRAKEDCIRDEDERVNIQIGRQFQRCVALDDLNDDGYDSDRND